MYIEGSGSSTPRCACRGALGTHLARRIVTAVSDIVWSPTPEYVERANVTRFMRAHGIDTYEDLVQRSVEDICLVLGRGGPRPRDRVPRALRAGPRRLAGRRMGDVVRGRTDQPRPSMRGPVGRGDARKRPPSCGRARTATRGRGPTPSSGGRRIDSRERSRRSGVAAGDAVGIFLPMLPETVAAVMACSKIGAIWVPIFSGFGPDAVAVRLEDAGVSVLLTADAFLRKGRAVPMLDAVRSAVASVDTVRDDRRPAARGRGRRSGGARLGEPGRGRVGRAPPLGAAGQRASPVHRVHERYDRQAEGGPPRPRRVPREDRLRGRLPGRPASGRGAPLGDGPRLDHGALGDRRRARARLDRVPLRRRPDPPGSRSTLVARRAAPHHDARRLPDV